MPCAICASPRDGAAGVIEAKNEGVTLTGMETHSDRYAQGLPDTLPAWNQAATMDLARLRRARIMPSGPCPSSDGRITPSTRRSP